MTTAEKEEITIESLPEEFRETAEIIGLEAALKLVDYRGGGYLYVPSPKKLTMPSRNREIYDAYKECKDRHVFRILAQKFELCENRIREIVRDEHRRRFPPPQQTNLF